MSTDTLTAPRTTKSWISLVIMFVAGLGGGAIALSLLSSNSDKSNPTAQAATALDNSGAAAGQRVASSAEDATLQQIRLLRDEVEKLRTATQTSRFGPPAFETEVAPRSDYERRNYAPPTNTGRRTLDYWNQLNNIMSQEATMRAAPPQITAANALSFVSGRTSAFQFAGSAIRKLDAKDVDPQAVGIGRDIAAWYDQGIANSRNAESLLGSGDIASRQGAPGQSWSAAEKQHRETCLYINSRGKQLRRDLSRKYGIDFPALQ